MESYPLWFFVLFVLVAIGIVVRRLGRNFSGSRELDRAEFEGRLKPDLRRRWNRNAAEFILFVIGTILFTIWILHLVDQMLKNIV